MQFNIALGSDQTKQFKFMNYLRSNTTYTCEVQKIGHKVELDEDEDGGEGEAAARTGYAMGLFRGPGCARGGGTCENTM